MNIIAVALEKKGSLNRRELEQIRIKLLHNPKTFWRIIADGEKIGRWKCSRKAVNYGSGQRPRYQQVVIGVTLANNSAQRRESLERFT